MKNKNLKSKDLKSKGTRNSKNGRKMSNASPFDMDSIDNSEYPWWEKLFIKIILPHKNKFIDRIVDIGCLLTIMVFVGGILSVAFWMFNLLQKVIS